MNCEVVEIGKRIVRMRKQKNMTQEELGGKLNVKNNTVSTYEKERILLAFKW